MTEPNTQLRDMLPGKSGRNHVDGLPPYYAVSIGKFIAMCLLTGGAYEIYWAYKNWKFVKANEQSNIWPWARALFAPLSYYALLTRLGLSSGSVGLGLAYFGFTALWRLPDPYWLLSYFAFLPLLPAVREINTLNVAHEDAYRKHSAWRAPSFIAVVLFCPLMIFGVTSSLGIIPSTQVQRGWVLWSHQAFLRETVGIAPDERVLYFYSAGFLSIETDGNILTDRRLISYLRDPESGDFLLGDIAFNDIQEVRVSYGSWLEDTTLTVIMNGDPDVWFELALSAELDRDRLFVSELGKFISPSKIVVAK